MIGNRMKCSPTSGNALEYVLKSKPEVLEFYLREHDLFEKRHVLENAIESCKLKDVRKIVLHQPPFYGKETLDIISEKPGVKEHYEKTSRIMADICKSHHITAVIHPHYEGTRSSQVTAQTIAETIEELKRIDDYSRGLFYWENSIEGVFTSQNPKWIEEIIAPLDLHVNQDISHSFIALKGDMDALEEEVRMIQPFVKYRHIVDSLGVEHDGLELGKGRIQWEKIKPYLDETDFIFEIMVENLDEPIEMIRSMEYWNALICVNTL